MGVFPEIERRLLAEAEDEDAWVCFLEGFKATLFGQSGDAGGEDTTQRLDSELVWSDNVRQCLSARQRTRHVEATERAKRVASDDDFADQLRAALAESERSTVQVEEVQD